MARIYDITSYLPRKSTFVAGALNAEAFDASRERLFGARARMSATLAARGQNELRRDYEDDLSALADTLEALGALTSECKAIQEIADAATARLILAGQKICAEA